MSELIELDTLRKEVEEVTVLFSGDSGDGMQVIGQRLAQVSSEFGNDISSFPDFPAEIRAPAGTVTGVSGFKLCFSSNHISATADQLDVLIAMNPAALKRNIAQLRRGGTLIVNEDNFKELDIKKAGYSNDPLESDSIAAFNTIKVPMTKLTIDTTEHLDIGRKDALRFRNMFALGIVCWLYERPLKKVEQWISDKFSKKESILQGNLDVLNAGYNYADSVELFGTGYFVPEANMEPGVYRHINGNDALALGAVVASIKLGKDLFFASYPITPSSDILHALANYKQYGVKVFQSEDEIAAAGAAIGAAFAGNLALTSTSGPGLDLKQEAIGLAVMAELPMVIFDIQRGGPSTGLPTKTEQSDLLAAMHGRHGECDAIVLAATSPSDCFHMAQKAFSLAVKYMTPVFLLSDGYIANSVESWRLSEDLFVHSAPEETVLPQPDSLYSRDSESMARSWVTPGIPGYEHRLGGLEKDYDSGAISYDEDNHHKMVLTRRAKLMAAKQDIPTIDAQQYSGGSLLIVGWGGTAGSLKAATEQLKSEGYKVDLLMIKYLFPLQNGLKEALNNYSKILVCELNLGQLSAVIKSELLIEHDVFQKVAGSPFKIEEVCLRSREILAQIDGESVVNGTL
ncbi:2-oxoacid:acceptor oxidoreductase subunit alpha [Alteromonas macleodii]|uniref:2-oxoglutarate oxidoreductase subunit KorA n=1 Tax=Alteromonas macleodii TaxID=28108 RepID=A0A6T9Y367_ALTMA|nr:2-oxoacid:acceptor oxidoreductase subunit alpha [Alteromonas macleodii]CAB9495195.1 2-oxoglutarate oxidoreductase subunit KorA [Alteromonas macleodii]